MNHSWQLQNFDTKFFGFKTAKILTLTAETIVDLLKEFKENNVLYATYRLRASDFTVIHALENNGFILVDGTIALELKQYEAIDSIQNIREATVKDVTELKELSRSVFGGTRFY